MPGMSLVALKSSATEHLHLTRIIREYYLNVDATRRPRIFGMTASPVDAKCDIAEAAT